MSTWMIVEDDADPPEVLYAMCELWGVEGVIFMDGEEAEAWIDDVDRGAFLGELPELALLDVRLPGSTQGHDVAARLRKSPQLGDIAIVLCTAYRLNGDDYDHIMKHAGADRLMYKPLPRFNELQKILEETLAVRRSKVSGLH